MITKEEILDLTVTKKDLLRLSQFHNTSCISIYIPTHRMGVETFKGQDALNLKNQLKIIRTKLSDMGMSAREIENLVNPVLDLIEDADFWRHQSGGLSLFLSHDIFERFTVPVRFEPYNYLSSEFYLKPILSLFNDYGLFYLLTLKKDEVRFFEGNKYRISEIDLGDSVPSRLEDRVGYDFEQKQLQFRSLGKRGGGSFHGHGESEAREKSELLLFFQSIDKGIMSRLQDSHQPPLLLCCIDYYYPLYKEANTYKNLFAQHISYNPADLDTRSLHEKAWQLLEPYFNNALHQRKERFMIGLDKGKASSNIREIIPASIQGKVDTLFLEKNAEIFGIFDPSTGGISIQEELTISNVSLMNLAGKKVFEQGGTVYVLENKDMPDNSSPVNALFRF